MSDFRTAYIYVRDEYCGMLEETENGYRFTYDQNFLKQDNASAVSLTLPLKEEPYESATLFSFFDGLIPEGWLLKVVSDNWKLSRQDRFGILLVACKDAIGNVSVKEDRS